LFRAPLPWVDTVPRRCPGSDRGVSPHRSAPLGPHGPASATPSRIVPPPARACRVASATARRGVRQGSCRMGPARKGC